MKMYTDYVFYAESFRSSGEIVIPEKEAHYFLTMATAEIRHYTFGRIDAESIIPEEVQMCCCELAEKLYSVEAVKGENGMILQSYGNDGETGTYKTDDLSEGKVQESISRIIRKWLAHTGLMYCGVK